jgi:hypothetical protein
VLQLIRGQFYDLVNISPKMFDFKSACFAPKQYFAKIAKMLAALNLNSAVLPKINICVELLFKKCQFLFRGRCYDHNFLRFFPIFGEKIGVFLKYQCYDQLFFQI